MVRPNPQNKRIRARQVQSQHQVAAAQFQGVLNSVLWKIITERCAEEAEPGEGDPCWAIPRSELAEVPRNFALNLKFDPETDMFTLSAVLVKPKSNLILPDRLQ